ncbi:ATP synthase F1 subunit delta [Leptothoe spongobia]|uniref:ATP synthase subunit delta n=1 Tax=Leptothoe spongobia TAU-MAC 1115 TaxID=1967444 RepID=A0A947DE50_9CYAN|nr:ATP synthase F1 subunit delta [Leptothoe spongobia]MBT9314928.1 F0F1 ATP synthase subunit delta [Leptothoe spongobia TAU-MAC 1115]
MKDSVVIEGIVSPYAQALLSVAQSNDLTDRFGQDASFLTELLSVSPDLGQLLENPIINPDIKKNVLMQLAGEQVHPTMLNFLKFLVDRGRIPFLVRICAQYQELLRQLNKAVLAEVTSAVALSDHQKEEIRQKVLAMTGASQVDLSTSLDPELIGGVVIKVGSQVVDASLRGQLRRISLLLNSPA